MALSTTGTTANSWITLDDANLILVDVHHPDIPTGFQLDTDNLPHLLEAARLISSCWKFKGYRTAELQTLAWPRAYVQIPGRPFLGWGEWSASCLPNWDPQLAYHINYVSPGLLSNELYPDDEVPLEVKEAQAILAALLANGVSIFEDNKGDNTQVSLGSLHIDNINAVARAAIVFQRLARWGSFIGGVFNKAGGSRG